MEGRVEARVQTVGDDARALGLVAWSAAAVWAATVKRHECISGAQQRVHGGQIDACDHADVEAAHGHECAGVRTGKGRYAGSGG